MWSSDAQSNTRIRRFRGSCQDLRDIGHDLKGCIEVSCFLVDMNQRFRGSTDMLLQLHLRTVCREKIGEILHFTDAFLERAPANHRWCRVCEANMAGRMEEVVEEEGVLIDWQSEEVELRTGFDRCVNSLSAVCFDSSQSDLRIFQDDAQSFTFSRKSRYLRTQQFTLAQVEAVHGGLQEYAHSSLSFSNPGTYVRVNSL